MIIKYSSRRNIGIPTIIMAEKDRIVGEPVNLPPGYTEIDNAVWALARPQAIARIESGQLQEEWVKVPTKDAAGIPETLQLPDPKDATFVRVPARFADLDRKGNKVIEVVKQTFNEQLLDKWYESDLRQDVRVEIQKQRAGIADGSIKG